MSFDLLLLNHSTAFHTLMRSEHHATLCRETWQSLVGPCLRLSFVFGVVQLVSCCSCGAAAGLWFPELVRLMLQKLTKERLHSRAGQHVSRLSLWSIRPSLYCRDMYRTGSLSLHMFGKHHHSNNSSNTTHCQRSCALSSVITSVLCLFLTTDQKSKSVPHSASLYSQLSRTWGEEKRERKNKENGKESC